MAKSEETEVPLSTAWKENKTSMHKLCTTDEAKRLVLLFTENPAEEQMRRAAVAIFNGMFSEEVEAQTCIQLFKTSFLETYKEHSFASFEL